MYLLIEMVLSFMKEDLNCSIVTDCYMYVVTNVLFIDVWRLMMSDLEKFHNIEISKR